MEPLKFSYDCEGKEILLKEGKFQVMMEWEKPYMESCIDALQPSGDVLEVGFGCGYAAERIQSYHPKSHTIIECDPVVAQRAREWAKKHSPIILIEDTWQHALATLGIFDAIFFDDYPLQSSQEMKKIEADQESASLFLQAGRKKMAEIEKALPSLKSVHYSDKELFAFVQEHAKTADAKQLFTFFEGLEKDGQISTAQKKKIYKELIALGKLSQKDIDNAQSPLQKTPFDFEERGDRLFTFLEECLKRHMRSGSRFCCFLSDPTSKYEDKKFFNHIITNPFLDYKEKIISIDVPSHCEYYKSNQALVITIKKIS